MSPGYLRQLVTVKDTACQSRPVIHLDQPKLRKVLHSKKYLQYEEVRVFQNVAANSLVDTEQVFPLT